MPKYASKMVELAQSLVGIKEGSSGHKEILAIYRFVTRKEGSYE